MIVLANNVGTLETSPAFEPFSRVTLIIGTDENGNEVSYTAGDDAGRELTAKCPWSTQTIADNLLAEISGYAYLPYAATDALLDPAAELGDTVLVGGIASVLGSIETTFDALYTADIEAPESEEINHEYPYQDKGTRNIERKIAQSSASLKIDIDAITAQVTDEIAQSSASLKIDIDAIISQVTDGQGNYTALTLRSDGLHVGNAQGTVTIGSGSIYIPNGAISFGDGTLNGALQAAYDNTGGGDPNPSYIKSTYIDRAKIVSPNIYGGLFYATGQGKNNGAAYYIYDGADIDRYGNVTLGNKIGFISYDTSGTGYDAPRRVIFKTLNDEALKLEAAGNMSLQAKDYIFVHTPLHLASGVHYGTVLPSEGLSPGRLFFLLDE